MLKYKCLFVVFYLMVTSCLSTNPPSEKKIEQQTKVDGGIYEKAKHEDISEQSVKEIVPEDIPEDIIGEHCKWLRHQWDIFLKMSGPDYCKMNEDCVIVGYHGDCNCSNGLSPNGTVLSKENAKKAASILSAFFPHCPSFDFCTADAAKWINLRCNSNNICIADSGTCLRHRD